MAYDPLSAGLSQQDLEPSQSSGGGGLAGGIQGEIFGQVLNALGVKTIAQRQQDAQNSRQGIQTQLKQGLNPIEDKESDARAKSILTHEEYSGLKKYVNGPEFAAHRGQMDFIRQVIEGATQMGNFDSPIAQRQGQDLQYGGGAAPAGPQSMDTRAQGATLAKMPQATQSMADATPRTPEQKAEFYSQKMSPNLVQLLAGDVAGQLAMQHFDRAAVNMTNKEQMQTQRELKKLELEQQERDRKTSEGNSIRQVGQMEKNRQTDESNARLTAHAHVLATGLAGRDRLIGADGKPATIAQVGQFARDFIEGKDISGFQYAPEAIATGQGSTPLWARYGLANSSAADAQLAQVGKDFQTLTIKAKKGDIDPDGLKSQMDVQHTRAIDAVFAQTEAYLRAVNNGADPDPQLLISTAYQRVKNLVGFNPPNTGWTGGRNSQAIVSYDVLRTGDPQAAAQAEQEFQAKVIQRAVERGILSPQDAQAQAQQGADAMARGLFGLDAGEAAAPATPGQPQPQPTDGELRVRATAPPQTPMPGSATPKRTPITRPSPRPRQPGESANKGAGRTF